MLVWEKMLGISPGRFWIFSKSLGVQKKIIVDAFSLTPCYFYIKVHYLINNFHNKRVIRVVAIQKKIVNAFSH